MPQKQKESFYIGEDGPTEDKLRGMWQWFSSAIQLFGGGKAKVTIERPTRSLRQNAALWGVIYPQLHDGLKDAGVHDFHLMDEDGELMTIPITVNFLHMLMKRRHLTPEEPGKEPSTRNLSTTEFTEYIRAIRHDPLVEKHGIHITPPNQPPPEAYE